MSQILVIERPSEGNIKVTSFEDSREGQDNARAHFSNVAVDTLDVAPIDLLYAIENGYVEHGGSELYLVYDH